MYIHCRQQTVSLTLRDRRFETPTWQEPIKQDRKGTQLFRPCWDSSALCSEDMYKVAISRALQSDPASSPYQVPYFEPSHLFPETRSGCHSTCFGGQRDKVSWLVSQKQKVNVAGQGQPKNLNSWPVTCFKNAVYHIWKDLRSKST